MYFKTYLNFHKYWHIFIDFFQLLFWRFFLFHFILGPFAPRFQVDKREISEEEAMKEIQQALEDANIYPGLNYSIYDLVYCLIVISRIVL